MEKVLEVCCADIASVRAAALANAPRIELCSVLAVGGVTPSTGTLAIAREIYSGAINVLIRHREGDFIYNDTEKEVMLADIEAVAGKADGVVVGALDADGNIDLDFASQAVSKAKSLGLSITFHRAFDDCKDQSEALEQLIALGYDRILTSGGADNVCDGLDSLTALVRQADGRIIILPGGGVNTSNAAMVTERSGATEIHGSGRKAHPPTLAIIRPCYHHIHHQKYKPCLDDSIYLSPSFCPRYRPTLSP